MEDAAPAQVIVELCGRVRACDPTLLEIDLSNQKLCGDDIVALVKTIEEAPVMPLRRLSVAGNEVGDKAIQSLYNVLYACPHLTELDISGTGIDEHTMAVLGNHVRKCFSLTTVRSKQKRDGRDVLEDTPSLCPGCFASTVNVKYYLRSNRSLVECASGRGSTVLLSSRRLDDIPAALSRSMLQHTLKELYLCNNNLTEIPEALNDLPLLEHLDLASNYISTVRSFTRSMHPNLAVLSLDDNILDGYEVHDLMESHANFPRLALLDLRSNALPSISCFLNAIQKGSDTLKHVYLSGNPLYDCEDASGLRLSALRADGCSVELLKRSKEMGETDPCEVEAAAPRSLPFQWQPALPYVDCEAIRCGRMDVSDGQLAGFPKGSHTLPASASPVGWKMVLQPAPATEWRRPRFNATLTLGFKVIAEDEVRTWVDAAQGDELAERVSSLERRTVKLLHHIGRDSLENALRTMSRNEVAVFWITGKNPASPTAFRPIIGDKEAEQDTIAVVWLEGFEEDSSVCDDNTCMRKKTIKVAPPERKAQMPRSNSVCGVHYSIRSMCGLLLFPKAPKNVGERRELWNACSNVITLKLESARTPNLFRLAVMNMEAGEIAQFRVCSRWLSSGLQPGGGHDEDWKKLIDAAPMLLLDVHLIYVQEHACGSREDPLSEQLMVVRTKMQMASTAQKKGNMEGAVGHYKCALNELSQIENLEGASKTSVANDIRLLRQNCHIALAAIAIKEKDFELAMRYCSLDGCDSVPAGPFRAQARFACVCLKEGELDAAGDVIEKFLAIKDTLCEAEVGVLEKLDERRRRLSAVSLQVAK